MSATITVPVVPVPVAPKRVVPLFRDLGKNTNDLFLRGFPLTHRFEYTTVAENGLKFVSVVERKTRKGQDESGKDVSTDYFFGSFQPKIELRPQGVNFIGTIDTEKVAGELSLADILTPGLKATFKGSATERSVESSGELEYRKETATLNLGVIYRDSKPKLDLGAVLAHQGLALGVQVGYFLPLAGNAGAVEGFAVATNYNTPIFDLLVSLNGKYDKAQLKLNVGGKALYNHNAKTQFATDVSYDLSKSFPTAVALKLLAAYKFDEATSAKAKIDTIGGNIGLAYAQKLNSNVTLTLGTEINAFKAEEHKLGFSLTFAP
eukprot:TRINITY_DN1715_c0_g2_i1.p1 TRINITY_DN1715_c0_g2~~TRINITY_DN1715_c0_g2_i1.p1  ORF type:complete len:320 (-),score=87.92 TRINITY_DN1715_c0_g2_i1:51-1010(-)